MPQNRTLFIRVDASLGIILKIDTSSNFSLFVKKTTNGMLLLKCHYHCQVLMDMIAFTSGINCLEVGYELTVKQLLKLSSDLFVRWFRMIVPLYSYLIIKHLKRVLSICINMFHETQTWDIKSLKSTCTKIIVLSSGQKLVLINIS